MTKIKYVCPECGSDEVVWDAWAEWDEQEQAMVLKTSFDHSVCDACGETIHPDEVEIDQPGIVPPELWHCPDCGCVDVQGEFWTNLNSLVPLCGSGGGRSDFYCPSCQDHGTVNEGNPYALLVAHGMAKAMEALS